VTTDNPGWKFSEETRASSIYAGYVSIHVPSVDNVSGLLDDFSVMSFDPASLG
jgi:hypothetical protein